MRILLGLILSITAVVVTLTGAAMHAGGSQGFLFGVEIGVVGMLGLALVRGDVTRHAAARRLRRAGDRYRRDIDAAVSDRDRLARDLIEVRARVARAQPALVTDGSDVTVSQLLRGPPEGTCSAVGVDLLPRGTGA